MSRKRGFSTLCVITAMALTANVRASTCTVDASADQQTIDGFGFSSAWSGTLSSAKNDALYNTLGMSLLRIRIDPTKNWAAETANAAAAHAHGAKVMGTPWTPPASMKSNDNPVGGSLNASEYSAYAAYLKEAASSIGLDYVSIQNEPDYKVTYESCDWTPTEIETFMRDDAGSIGYPVIMPESFHFDDAYSDPTLNDSAAAKNVAIVAGHIYGNGLRVHQNAIDKGKPVWMTEHFIKDTETTMASCLPVAKEISDCMNDQMSAYIWWWVNDNAQGNENLVLSDGTIFKNGYTIGQFAKWIRPGDVHVTADYNPSTDVYITAYKSSNKLVIVAVNQGTSPVDQSFALNHVNVSSMTPWITSDSQNMEQQAAISVSGGAFAATLPAGSVTTFVGDATYPTPTIASQPQDVTVATGSTVALDVAATGEYMTYQWSHDGTAISGATSPLLAIDNAQASDAGTYTVKVTTSGGSVTSSGATVNVVSTTDPGRLVNISTRSMAGTGDNVQIAGFVVSGSGPQQVLVRAAGPALTATFNLTGVLADPMIELHQQSTGNIVASNDNWDSSLANTFKTVGAFSWTAGSKDAAVEATLDPGAYTAVVKGADGGSGVSLVEVYQVSTSDPNLHLVNISTRSLVGTGDNAQIAGFVIGGSTAKTVVIRAAGPALFTTFGLGGVLADPVIELHAQSTGNVIATNDNWSDSLASYFSTVGAFSWNSGSRDAAMLITLNPGAYTVVVRGKNNTTGLNLVEVYALP